MCRHLAYVGPAVTLAEVVLDPPHSLAVQASAPRLQRNSRMNADGFGVGWYDHPTRPEPARYRRSTPIWADRSLRSFAPLVRTTALLGAVRSASPGLPIEESGNAPFVSGRWLFSLNGTVFRWHEGAGAALRGLLSPARAAGIEGASDSEVLFGLFLDQLAAATAPADALEAVLAAVESIDGGRLNLLTTDGHTLFATVWGDTLFARVSDTAAVLASEPWDDEEGAWRPLADATIVAAVPGSLTERSVTR